MKPNTHTDDREIVERLIAGDNEMTDWFFHVKCRPLLLKVMNKVPGCPQDYTEVVNELWLHLLDNDCANLRQFRFRSSLCQWLKTVAVRLFFDRRPKLIEYCDPESLYMQMGEDSDNLTERDAIRIDLDAMIAMVSHHRYAEVLRELLLQDRDMGEYAREINVTPDNLYNIKKRAMTALTQIALKHYPYGH